MRLFIYNSSATRPTADQQILRGEINLILSCPFGVLGPVLRHCVQVTCYLNTESLPDPVSRKSLRLVIARTSIFCSVFCVDVPTCGNSMFCGNARNRGFTRGSSGNTSRPTDANYVTR